MSTGRKAQDGREFIRESITIISDGELEDFKQHVRETYDVELFIKMTPPKTIKFDNEGNSVLKIVTGSDGSIVPIQRVSPYLESLISMNHYDQLLHIFLVGNCIKNSDTVQKIENELKSYIKDKYLEVNVS